MRRASSIRTKLLALLAVPLAALTIVAGLGVVWSADTAAGSRRSVSRTQTAVVTVRAALELSRERGLSAGTMADPADTDTARELDFQRGQTDVAITKLAGSGTGWGSDRLEQLGGLRSAVGEPGSSVGDVLAGYTALVDALLDEGTARIRAVTDSDLVARGQSYESLTRAVDAIALEQSLLMPVLARGSFDQSSYDALVGAVAIEQQWRRRFEQSAGPEERSTYDAALAGPAVSVTGRLLDEALAVGPTGRVAGDADLWFTSATRKVDLLTGAADEIAADLSAAAESQRAAASRRQLLFAALGVAAVALIAGLMVLLHRIVVRPIRRLTAAAHEMASATLPRAVELTQTLGPDAADEAIEPLTAAADDELGELTDAFNTVQRTAVSLAADQAVLRRNVNDVFVNLGRRTQNLITRQLGHIDHLEARTDDPDALADLFLLDHLATRMRRNAENLLVIAGAESPRPWVRPVSIVSVVRAALAEATDYTRVDIEHLAPVAVLGSGVSDISHLVAELVDNSLAYSPPTERVVVTGRWTYDGRYAMAVIDAGLGMTSERLAEANARITDPPVRDFAVSRFLGLYVVGRLADRHGIEVTLTPSPLGGVTAHIVLPDALLSTGQRADPAPGRAPGPAPALPTPPPSAPPLIPAPVAHRSHG